MSCELIRRGGHKKGRIIEANEINGRVQQLREQNQREHGEKIVDGKARTAGPTVEAEADTVKTVDETTTLEYDFDNLKTNPAAPNPPWDFSIVDFAALEKQALGLQEATDDWAAAEESRPERVWKTDPLTTRQILIEEWWGQQRRPFSGPLGTYIRNVMDQGEGEDWAASFEWR